jgi:hypothetical protein
MAIVPVAHPLLLCEEIDEEGGMLNVYALFNAIRPRAFPHVVESFSAFAQLSGGLGEVPVHYDIVRARDESLVHTTLTRPLRFERRTQLLQLVTRFEGLRFDEPGVYLVQLFCDNTWVADVVLELTERE